MLGPCALSRSSRLVRRDGAAAELCCTDAIDALSNESTRCRETGRAPVICATCRRPRATPPPRRGRRPARPSGDDRELAILATAERLLAERPLAAISVDDLARGAGISRPTFYFYFPSKDAVLLTLLDRVVAEADAATAGAFDAAGRRARGRAGGGRSPPTTTPSARTGR